MSIEMRDSGFWLPDTTSTIRTFLPDSCAEPFHYCISIPMSWTTSPTENAWGCNCGSKKKDPRTAQSSSDVHENVAETCTSPPDNTYESYVIQRQYDIQNWRACRCRRVAPHFNVDYQCEFGKASLSSWSVFANEQKRLYTSNIFPSCDCIW